MPKHFIYPIYTGLLALLTFALVPRKEIRRLAVFAIISGGVTDVTALIIFSKILGMGEFVNFKYFGAFGLPLFPPIAWTAYFILFLYILPQNKPWKYIFPVITACYSTYFAYVLQELGIFRWYYSPVMLLLLVFLPWQSSVAWFYLRSLKVTARKHGVPKHYFRVPAYEMKKERSKTKIIKPKKL